MFRQIGEVSLCKVLEIQFTGTSKQCPFDNGTVLFSARIRGQTGFRQDLETLFEETFVMFVDRIQVRKSHNAVKAGPGAHDRPFLRAAEHRIADPDLDLPFCLHWANEPWTSSWDGCIENRILLEQNHTPEDDLAFIRGIERALFDSRYIRVNGRPLLAVYRPGLFPDIKATVERWREHCVKEGIGELYLVVTQQPFDGAVDPSAQAF